MNIRQDHFIRRNRLVREGLREILTKIPSYQPSSDGRNIMLLSSGRSGSTLLMESLAAEPGLRFVNEPFSTKHLYATELAEIEEFQEVLDGKKIISISPDTRRKMVDYLTSYKEVRRAGPYHPFKASYHLSSDRLLYKVIKVNPVAEMFYEHPELWDIIWLVRHPCPTILSSLPMFRRFASIDIPAYLKNEHFRESYLTDKSVMLMEQVEDSGTDLQKWTVEWVLDHLVSFDAYRHSDRKPLLVSYEQLILEPELVIGKLETELSLQRPDRILKELKVPSASTRSNVMKEYKQFDPRAKVRQWRGKAPEGFEEAVFEILEVFGLDLYQPGRDILKEQYLIR